MNRILESITEEGWARSKAGVVKKISLTKAIQTSWIVFCPRVIKRSQPATIGGMIIPMPAENKAP